MLRFHADDLRSLASAMLAAAGVAQDEADLVASSLVQANLLGHDSHGVMRVPYYLDAVAAGEVVPGAPLEITREMPSLIVADGHWGFGQRLARELTKRLIDKARTTGVAVGTLIHSGHVGRLGEYCEQAAAAGMVVQMMVNTHGTARRVAPVGGIAPRLGTNPLAIAVPLGDTPLVLDFGTSATAEGKVRVKRIAGQLCPDGWLLDNRGNPTNDPHVLYGDPPGTIRPMGGDQAYKGFGLALMVEIFAGALSGGVCARAVPINPVGNCVFMQVLAPECFGEREHFAREVSDLAAFMRACPPRDETVRIELPGDPERRAQAERLERGIPLDRGNWDQLAARAKKQGVPLPAPLSDT